MTEENEDHLSYLLAEGWVVVGYSTAMMAMGGMVHSVLMQSGGGLISVSTIKTGNKEIGRTVDVLAPMPISKKTGWF